MASSRIRKQLSGVSIVAIGAVVTGLLTSGHASATPTGTDNLYVTCTTTISNVVPVLAVTQGITCIDGRHGGGVTGNITVGAGAGLYVENATVGAIIASHPEMVWLCGGTTRSINVSYAAGLDEHQFGPLSFSTDVGCPTDAEPTINGPVTLSHDLAGDRIVGATVNGSVLDTYNTAPEPGEVDVSFATLNSSVTIRNATSDTFVEDATVHGTVIQAFNTGPQTDVDDSMLYNGLVMVNNPNANFFYQNAVHGPVVLAGNGPTTIHGNTTF